MAKEGSTVGGMMDAFGTAISMSLQYGVPLEDLVNKFSHMRFEPMGHTTNPEIRIARSMVDYIFRWMGIRFLAGYQEQHASLNDKPQVPTPEDSDSQHKPAAMKAGGLNAAKEGSGSKVQSSAATGTGDRGQGTVASGQEPVAGTQPLPAAKANGNGHHGPNGTNGSNGNGHSHAAAKKADVQLLERPAGKLHDSGFSPAVR